jgi:hypothetical protein
VANPNIQPIATLELKITNITMSSWRFSRWWDLLLTKFGIKLKIAMFIFCYQRVEENFPK